MKILIRLSLFLFTQCAWSLHVSAQESDNFSVEESADESSPCLRLYQSTMSHYLALGKFLPSNFRYQLQIPSHQLLKIPGEPCSDSDDLTIFEKTLSLHSGKIGILLPFSRWNKSTQAAVINQIKAFVQSKNQDPQKRILWFDTAGQIDAMQRQLAQLVFAQHVSLLIGGITTEEAPILARWGDKLRIPTLLLNRKFENIRSPFVFHLGPDINAMADALVNHVRSKAMSKVAIIMPQTSRDGILADAFSRRLHKMGVQVSGPLLYNPNDFNSLDRLFKKLFYINDPERKEELLQMLEARKLEATEAGMSFDPKTVMLPAKVDIQSLMIVDNFRNVTHIAKILKYYGVNQLPLMGIPKWRAPELLTQAHDQINGSYFVDYIGSYRKLPYGIEPQSPYDENFVDGSQASVVDLQVVINHAVAIALKSIRSTQTPRYSLYKLVEQVQNDSPNFFGSGMTFKAGHLAFWPSFLYTVSQGKLVQRSGSPIRSQGRSAPTTTH